MAPNRRIALPDRSLWQLSPYQTPGKRRAVRLAYAS